MVAGGSVERRRLLGQRAEGLAAAYLARQGYTITARNWRRPGGEIDLVAARGDLCVFVEVRSRTGIRSGHPLETVGPAKRVRILRSARLFLDEERPRASAFRFDVVGVTFPPHHGRPDIAHVEDAFRAER